MSDIDDRLPAETYLAHSEWVRRLARRLLDDEGAADDVAQETWIALLRQPAGSVRDLRAWLRGVTRKLALRSSRDRTRRLSRATEEVELTAPSAEDVLEAEAVRKQVIDAVLELDDPYRSTVLLHFYEQLNSEEIARRLGVPSSTVRTRLQRGLERLREKLGGEPTGREKQHLRSMLLIVVRKQATSTVSGQGVILAMSIVSKTAVLCAVLVVALLVAWFALGTSHSFSARTDKESALAGSTKHETALPTSSASLEAPSDVDTERRAIPADAALDGRWHLSAQRTSGSISGTIVDVDTDAPAQGATVRVRTSTGPVIHNVELAEDRPQIDRTTKAGSGGEFRFDDLPSGPYVLDGALAGKKARSLQVAATARYVPVILTLHSVSEWEDRIEALIVRTFDDAGAALSGVDVVLEYRTDDVGDKSRTMRTDAKGSAQFDHLRLRNGVLLARASDGRVGQALVLAGADEHSRWLQGRSMLPDPAPVYRITLAAPGGISGTIRGGGRGVVVHARLGAHNYGFPHESKAQAGEDGTFHIGMLPVGDYLITVDAPAGLRAAMPRWGWVRRTDLKSLFPTVVEVGSGVTTNVEIPLVPCAVVRGRITESDGTTPITNAIVKAWIVRENFHDPGGYYSKGIYLWPLTRKEPADEWLPGDWQRTTTDTQGRFVISGLDASAHWALDVLSPDHARDLRHPLELKDGQTKELDFALVRSGGIQGIARQNAHLAFLRTGDAAPVDSIEVSYGSDGTFVVPHLVPGHYSILISAQNTQTGAVGQQAVVAEVDVNEGELAWVDLRDAASHSVSVKLTEDGKALRGASIQVFTTGAGAGQGFRATSDENGVAEFHFPFTTVDAVMLEVSQPARTSAARTQYLVPHLMDGTPSQTVALEIPGGAVDVIVADEQGSPVRAGVRLEPTVRWNNAEPTTTLTFTKSSLRSTDADGRARFDCIASGRFQLWVIGETGWMIPTMDVDVTAGRATKLSLVKPQTGAVIALVLDAQGRPARGVHVSIEEPSGDHGLAWPRWTDESGAARFLAVPVGAVTIRAERDMSDPAPDYQGTANAEIVQGRERSVTIRLE